MNSHFWMSLVTFTGSFIKNVNGACVRDIEL
jgi:hypothetical protein